MNATASKACITHATATAITCGLQVDVSINESGKVSAVYATYRCPCPPNFDGTMESVDAFLASNPTDDEGKPLVFVLRRPKSVLGVKRLQLSHSYTGAGLLKLAEELAEIDFMADAAVLS